ncbi:hypothetical protein E2C01_049300 [Portunus trituberculatus]|uniref:Uncharacterized protein n=1 Tax=Portunus trituberculatus TaxID=210409 RepID=A0A5B7GDH9_PORTR|nr:hypothetical protein [Portunus trituberculatus]
MERENRKCLGKMVVVLWPVLSSDTKLALTLTSGMPAFSLYISCTKLPIILSGGKVQPDLWMISVAAQIPHLMQSATSLPCTSWDRNPVPYKTNILYPIANFS